MALKKLPFRRLEQLIRRHLSTSEFTTTQNVIDALSVARTRGFLTKSDLVRVCRWKSARAIRHIKRNRGDVIQNVTRAAFRTRSERTKIALLTRLHGVGVPMASSILMLTNPSRYGVLDIRVWQLLHAMGTVTTNANGVAFDFNEWLQYLMILRTYARKYGVGARDVERTLFHVHTLHQKGTVYK